MGVYHTTIKNVGRNLLFTPVTSNPNPFTRSGNSPHITGNFYRFSDTYTPNWFKRSNFYTLKLAEMGEI